MAKCAWQKIAYLTKCVYFCRLIKINTSINSLFLTITKLFAMKLHHLFQTLLFGGLLSVSLTACSDDDDPKPAPEPDPDPVAYAVQLTMTDNGFALADGGKFTPGFNVGDKAGLFVVINGELVASNVELMFDGTAWKAAEPVSSKGEKYFVYTPYNADAASKVTVTATDAAEFFAGLVADCAVPGMDQADFAVSVSPFDVTYAEASVTEDLAISKVETLTLTAAADHALAVTSWNLPGGTSYKTADGFIYSTPGSSVCTGVALDDKAIVPCTVNGLPSFFSLPAVSGRLTVDYTQNGMEKIAEVKLNDKAGTVQVSVIEGGSADGGTRDLKVGDLFYCDGSIIPVESLDALDEAPAGVAGVIFCVDKNRFSEKETELLGNVHALVISAKMATFKNREYIAWCDAYPKPGDDGDGRYDDSVEDPNFPGQYLPLIQDRTDASKSYEINNSDINGYSNTEILRARRSNEISLGYYPTMAAIENLNKSVAVTANSTTGWYLPSAGQMLDFMRNIGGAKVSAEVVEHLSTSSELGDFSFGENSSPNLVANLDKAMSKIKADEKSLYADSRFAVWTSSYASLYHAQADRMMPGAREIVFNNDFLFVMAYDVIGKGNVRGVLAF